MGRAELSEFLPLLVLPLKTVRNFFVIIIPFSPHNQKTKKRTSFYRT